MTVEVDYRPEAQADLERLYLWIADHADPGTAWNYVSRIQLRAAALADYPEIGSPRDDLSPGLRSISFRRRTMIFYLFIDRRVSIVRVLHGGQDVSAAFPDA